MSSLALVQDFMDMLDPDAAKRRFDHQMEWNKTQLKNAEAWDPERTRFKPVLVLQGKTWKPRSFFKVPITKPANVNEARTNQLVISPNGQWCYAEKYCPPAYDCPLVYGRERGVYMFDTAVRIPALYEAEDPLMCERWKPSPWMSITPMEVLTLRPGTQRAKGTVVVAGMGLGNQLIDVSKRTAVKKIILVEQSRDLVDWLLPVIQVHMGHARHSMEVIIGDAYKEMPKLKADVGLVDIFPGFGCNEDKRDELRRTCPNIGFIWGRGCGAYRER